VERRWVRNAQGQKIHCIKGEPIPEPFPGCPAFIGYEKWTPIGNIIVEDYKRAKYPQSTPEDVRPIILGQEKIDSLLKGAEEWFVSYKG
jgi:hypothetical protein